MGRTDGRLAVSKKAEQGQATRRQIIETATRLFAAHGYAATSIDAVLLESAVSRGALYYHFDSKESLFAAVLEAVEGTVVQRLVGAAGGVRDPLEALRVGCMQWLSLALDPVVRQIVLVDAPSVIGWQKWRALDARYGFGLLKAGLKAATAAGRVREDLTEIFAHILLAALIETSMLIARADDAESAMARARAAIGELLERLLGPAPGQQA